MAETIKLKSYVDVQNEYVAAEAITPGMLIELNSDGKYQKHASSGSKCMPVFAIEDALQGKEIDEDYAADDQVRGWYPTRGDEVYAILQDGQDVSTGDLLDSNGDGTLKSGSGASAIAEALESLDLSGSSGEESSGALGYNKRIKVRVL